MILAALLDSGVPVGAVDAALAACGVDARVRVEEVSRAGLRAAHLVIDAGPSEADRSRQLPDCERALADAGLAPRLHDRAIAALRALAGAEAALHGVAVEAVHLHELSALDTLVDVVGCCAALEALDAEVVTVSPLPASSGTVATAHGALPLPAPAALALLAAAGAPLLPGPAGVELVTPTAAAVVATVGSFTAPRMRLRRVGHGAGTRDDPRRPNMVRCWVGEPLDGGLPGGGVVDFDDAVVELQTNLDDVTPAGVAHLLDRCLAAGALDAWVVPALMKKGRPGHVLHVLAADGGEAALAALIRAEGPTLGVRRAALTRTVAERDVVVLDLDGDRVRVKRRLRGGTVVDARPELDDVARVASRRGVPLDRAAADLAAAARRALSVEG